MNLPPRRCRSKVFFNMSYRQGRCSTLRTGGYSKWFRGWCGDGPAVTVIEVDRDTRVQVNASRFVVRLVLDRKALHSLMNGKMTPEQIGEKIREYDSQWHFEASDANAAVPLQLWRMRAMVVTLRGTPKKTDREHTSACNNAHV